MSKPLGKKRGPRDPLGNHEGYQAHEINLVLLTGPKSVAEILSYPGVGPDERIRAHLQSLKLKGYAIKKTPGKYELTLVALQLMGDEREIELQPEDADSSGEEYSPDGIDCRKSILQRIGERRGREAFRNALRKRYKEQCVVTGSTILALLEAAHISPYRGDKDNHVTNGLLLRADIHTLFDLDLLGIEPKSCQIELHSSVKPEYAYLAGKKLRCPAKSQPSVKALTVRYEKFRKRLKAL